MGRTLVSKKSSLFWGRAGHAAKPKSARQSKMRWHFIRRSVEKVNPDGHPTGSNKGDFRHWNIPNAKTTIAK
jgi:hypothetical protein